MHRQWRRLWFDGCTLPVCVFDCVGCLFGASFVWTFCLFIDYCLLALFASNNTKYIRWYAVSIILGSDFKFNRICNDIQSLKHLMLLHTLLFIVYETNKFSYIRLTTKQKRKTFLSLSNTTFSILRINLSSKWFLFITWHYQFLSQYFLSRRNVPDSKFRWKFPRKFVSLFNWFLWHLMAIKFV